MFDQPVLCAGRDIVLLHRQDQVFGQGVELGVSDGHVGVQLAHFPPGVGAGPATELAQLIREVAMELRHIHAFELLVDAIILDDQV